MTGSAFDPGTSDPNNLLSDDADTGGLIPRSAADLFARLERRKGNGSANGMNSAINTTHRAASDYPLMSANEAGDGGGGDGCVYKVTATYCEVYNEGVYDLLHPEGPTGPLPVRWDSARGAGFHAPGLTAVPCECADDLLRAIAAGLSRRRVGAHALNADSSRSHSLLTVHVESTPARRGDADYGATRFGKVRYRK
jgi:hypothetical protein